LKRIVWGLLDDVASTSDKGLTVIDGNNTLFGAVGLVDQFVNSTYNQLTMVFLDKFLTRGKSI